MKSTSLAVLVCLFYGAQAIKFETELLSIGERMRDIDQREYLSISAPGLDDSQKSNSQEARNLFGQVDVDSYNEDYKSVLKSVPINIRFENQSGMPQKIVYENKKVPEPKPVVVVAQKPEPTEEDELTEEQKKSNQDFLEKKMAEFKEENSVNTDEDVVFRSSNDYALGQANKQLDKIKAKQIVKNRLVNLKKQKVEAVQKLQQLEVKVKEDFTKKEEKLNEQWDRFCLGFKKEDYDKANVMYSKLQAEGAEDLAPLQIRTKQLYQKGFGSDEQSIAQNEIVQDLMEGLEIAQTNLNSNIKNPDLMVNFIKTAEQTKKNLKASNFGSFWHEPKSE